MGEHSGRWEAQPAAPKHPSQQTTKLPPWLHPGNMACTANHVWRCVQEQRRPDQEQKQAALEPPLLLVNLNTLKGDEEMRRMFGRDVVQMRHQEDQAADLGKMVS